MSGAARGPVGRRQMWVVAAAVFAVVLIAAGVTAWLRTRGEGTPSTASSSAPTTSSAAPPAPPTSTAPTTSSAGSPTTTAPTSEPTSTARSTPAPTTAAVPFPAALRGQDVTVLPTGSRVVALTFDAGSDAAGLPSILRTLAAQGVHATFFLTGRWAVTYPASVAAIRAAGHRIGNHTVTHPHLTAMSDAAVRDEVLGAQRTILATGADPRPLFRFPFGDRNARTIADVNGLGYVAVRWTVDSLGWEGTSGGQSVQSVADRAVHALRPGEIVLMHVGSNPDDHTTLDADALPQVISRMRAAGYGFVTLDALLAPG
ncbi:MAG: polysaccharide deacetylase family protein [Blastococcus sp.]